MTTQPHYDALEALIRERGWWFAASEAHGMQSALVACGSGARWPEILFAQGEIDPLAARAEALVAWVQGFTVAAHWLNPKLDDDCRAFLADLDEISKLDDRLADSEENRQMLTGLEEHCRMGALMLYAYCHHHNK